MSKTKIKKVTARVYEQTDYIAQTQCPYCKAQNESSVEEEEDMEETCWKCGKKYMVKIPKDSLW